MEKPKKNNWDSSHLWEEGLDHLKSIINKTPLEETIKWGAPVYTFKGKNVIGVMGFKDYFAMWFYKGVFLKDEAGVLVNASAEGTTKSLRQWRFTSKEEINEKQVLQYINEAIEVEKAGLAIKPEKKILAVPELLQKELKNSPALSAAFDKFSQSRQNEFNEYVGTAKREETALSRIKKIKPMILEGIGLNDKYR